MVLDTCSPAVCRLQFLLMVQKPAMQGTQMKLGEGQELEAHLKTNKNI